MKGNPTGHTQSVAFARGFCQQEDIDNINLSLSTIILRNRLKPCYASRSATFQMRVVSPASIAGVTRKV
jgi:hypothetical protein